MRASMLARPCRHTQFALLGHSESRKAKQDASASRTTMCVQRTPAARQDQAAQSASACLQAASIRNPPTHDGAAHAPGQLVAGKWRVLALAAQRLRAARVHVGLRVEHADVGHAAHAPAGRRWPAACPARCPAPRRLAGQHAPARCARPTPLSCAHFERQAQQQLQRRWRRARPRQRAGPWRRRPPACGRTPARRWCRRPDAARSASRSRCWRSGGFRRMRLSK